MLGDLHSPEYSMTPSLIHLTTRIILHSITIFSHLFLVLEVWHFDCNSLCTELRRSFTKSPRMSTRLKNLGPNGWSKLTDFTTEDSRGCWSGPNQDSTDLKIHESSIYNIYPGDPVRRLRCSRFCGNESFSEQSFIYSDIKRGIFIE